MCIRDRPNGFTTIAYQIDCLLKSLLKLFRGLAPECSVRHTVSARRSHPKLNIKTRQQFPWHLKDLRKTCATYYDEHIPESSIEILGHAVGGITYRHYAHRDPLAFRAIMTIPQPSAFLALVKGHDGECPCCRRPFVTAD